MACNGLIALLFADEVTESQSPKVNIHGCFKHIKFNNSTSKSRK